MLSFGQVVTDHSTYVSAQTVADAMYVIRGRARVGEMRVQLSCTLADYPRVPQRRQVTRVHGQRAPVHHEHIEVSASQVCCATPKTIKSDSYSLSVGSTK